MVGKAQKAQPWLSPTMIVLIIGINISSVIPRAPQSFYMFFPFSSAHSPVRWGPSLVSIRELSLSTVTKPASRKARLGHHSVQSPHFYPLQIFAGLPWWLSGKESACQCRRHRFDPWRKKWWPAPVFLPEKSHEQSNLVGYCPWGHKRVGHDWAHTQIHVQNR